MMAQCTGVCLSSANRIATLMIALGCWLFSKGMWLGSEISQEALAMIHGMAWHFNGFNVLFVKEGLRSGRWWRSGSVSHHSSGGAAFSEPGSPWTLEPAAEGSLALGVSDILFGLFHQSSSHASLSLSLWKLEKAMRRNVPFHLCASTSLASVCIWPPFSPQGLIGCPHSHLESCLSRSATKRILSSPLAFLASKRMRSRTSDHGWLIDRVARAYYGNL